MSFEVVIINYDEIILKGKNRPFFERILKGNIKEMLSGMAIGKINKEGGRIVIGLNDQTDIVQMTKLLEKIPGISNFSFVEEVESKIDEIFKKVLEVVKNNKLDEKYKTFKIVAKRANKNFTFTSPQINSAAGEFLLNNTSLKVDVHNPEVEMNINVGDKKTYIYYEKHVGVGGLPVGSSGKSVCLLSGGIDSPVAAYMMAKRGLEITFVHFKNKTVAGAGEGMDKIRNLVRKLNEYLGHSKLFIVPFDDFQKEIVINVSSKNRMIVYRRIMLKIAESIAKNEGAKAIIVGDSIGQVASQTVENISVAYKICDMPILAPLIGMNKQETIDIAEKLGTYAISIIPYPDCCSLMASKHPETKANIEDIEKQERNIDISGIISKIMTDLKPDNFQ